MISVRALLDISAYARSLPSLLSSQTLLSSLAVVEGGQGALVVSRSPPQIAPLLPAAGQRHVSTGISTGAFCSTSYSYPPASIPAWAPEEAHAKQLFPQSPSPCSLAMIGTGTAQRSLSSDARSAALNRLSRARKHRERQQPEMTTKPSRLRTDWETAGASDAASSADAPATSSGSGVAMTQVSPSETVASDAQLARVVDHQALVITRPIEWGTVILGYEQANKYQVFDESGTLVALMAEDYTGIGNEIGRQVLRTRRSFTATVFSADGSQVIFRVRRPAYLITSTMFIEDGKGETIGEVHRRWSLLQRNYDLYINKAQFAAITGNFLAWEFELKDSKGGTLALIDRNFQGFGKEIFTDAGKYVIHFGSPSSSSSDGQAAATEGAGATSPPSASSPPVTTVAAVRTGVAVIPTASGNQLAVARPMELSERMITLACAISIDYDFFSQHSHSSGFLGSGGFIPVPMPYPGGVGGGGAVVEGGAAAAAAAPDGNAPSADVGGQAYGEDSSLGQLPPGEPLAGGDKEWQWDQGGGDAGGGGSGEGGGIVGTLWGWVSGGND